MHYLDEGRGEPVLMLHGNPTWSFYYRRLILGLRSSNRCIAPDHIGCGFSSKPAHYSYRLYQHIENLEKLLEHLDLRDIHLVVHDWGGAIGMGLAQRCPERFKSLTLLNTGAFLSSRIPFRIDICRWPFFGPFAVRFLNGFARAALCMAMGKKERMTPNIARGFLAPYNSWANRIAIQRFVEDIPMKPADPSYALLRQIGERLETLRSLPVLICWGMKDFCFNESFLERWESEFPHAKVHRFPEAGHYVLEDEHEEIIPLVKRFIRERVS